MGINSLGTKFNSHVKEYENAIKKIHELSPSSKIYIISKYKSFQLRLLFSISSFLYCLDFPLMYSSLGSPKTLYNCFSIDTLFVYTTIICSLYNTFIVVSVSDLFASLYNC